MTRRLGPSLRRVARVLHWATRRAAIADVVKRAERDGTLDARLPYLTNRELDEELRKRPLR